MFLVLPDPDPLTQNFNKKFNFKRLKTICLWVNYKKKSEKIGSFASLTSLKKGVESGIGSGAGSGSAEVWIGGSRSAPKCHGSPTLFVTQSLKIRFIIPLLTCAPCTVQETVEG
jgi:hypothetical protein